MNQMAFNFTEKKIEGKRNWFCHGDNKVKVAS